MTKRELLHLLVSQASANGFDLCAWFQSKVDRNWSDVDSAITTLATGRRYYALLFSHDFARVFWKQGELMQFVVPANSFSRLNRRGETVTITRKPYIRRTLKPNAWRYHLREMATFDEPLRYIRRFLITYSEVQPKRLSAKASPPARLRREA